MTSFVMARSAFPDESVLWVVQAMFVRPDPFSAWLIPIAVHVFMVYSVGKRWYPFVAVLQLLVIGGVAFLRFDPGSGIALTLGERLVKWITPLVPLSIVLFCLFSPMGRRAREKTAATSHNSM